MDDLDRKAENLLAAFRTVDGLDERRMHAVERRLARSLEAEPPAWLDELEEPVPRPARARTRKAVVWWWAGVAAAVLLLIGVRLDAVRRDANVAPTAASRSQRPEPAAGTAEAKRPRRATDPGADSVRATEPALASPSSAPVTAPDPVTTSAKASATASPAPKRRHRSQADAGTAKTPERSPLAEELTLLDVADAALRRGEVATAASTLRTYRERFASGQLRTEALGLQTIVDCRRGRDGAEAAAATFLAAHPGSVLETRLTLACRLKNSPPSATDRGASEQSPRDDKP